MQQNTKMYELLKIKYVQEYLVINQVIRQQASNTTGNERVKEWKTKKKNLLKPKKEESK